MVKLVAGTLHLQNLFRRVLPLKKQIECPIRFTPLNAQVNFVFPSNEVGVLAKFSREYFKDFESSDEYFIVHQQLIEDLKNGFRHDFNVRFWTDLQHAHIHGEESGDKSIFQLIPVKEEMKELPFQPIMTEMGLMPTYEGKVLSFNVQARVAVETLVKDLPRGKSENKAGLSWDGETLKLYIKEGSGLYERPLSPKTYSFQSEPIAVYFDWNTFQDLAKQFFGEVWLGIAKAGVVVSKTDDGCSLTYLLRAERVDDEI